MLSQEVEKAVRVAIMDAHQRGHEFATVEHLCLALLDDPEINYVLSECEIDIGKLRKKLDLFLQHELHKIEAPQFETTPSLGFQRVIQRAAVHVMGAGREEVNPANLLVAIFAEDESIAVYLLKEAGLTRLDIVSSMVDEHEWQDLGDDDDDGDHEHHHEKDPLKAYASCLTQKAKNKELDALIGRQEEMTRVIHILLRRRKNNPLLVGEAGVGKTAIAEGLAQRIMVGDVPEALKGVEVFALDMGSLLAGTRYRGDFENRLKGVMKAIEKKVGSILVIDEIHAIIGAGSTSGGSMDASNLLKPILASGKIRCIGSTTYKEFRTHFEKDRALARRFQKVDIGEPSENDCIEILKGLRSHYEEFHHVRIGDEALSAAVRLSAKHLHDRQLPDKAIDLIDEAAAGLKLKGVPDSVVTESDIEETVARMAQIPTKQVSSDDRDALADLSGNLRAVVFGQDHAIEQIVTSIKLSRAGLREPEKPIGSFLFTGPTGVGKTEISKQLAKTLGISFIRFDMSEYMERHAVSRLIGAPPGYVGFDQGGLLTDAIHKAPHAVLLLDEIEKAHPDVFNMLLQILDYGKLTDSNGRATDFRHVVLIMTSNVGAREMSQARIGFGDTDNLGADETAFKKLFSPEFRNRLDARISFLPLKPEAMMHIVDKFLAELQTQLAERNVTIETTDKAKQYLAEKGYDKAMGARPLSRIIQDEIKRPLADRLLFGDLKNGGKVKIDLMSEPPCVPKLVLRQITD